MQLSNNKSATAESTFNRLESADDQFRRNVLMSISVSLCLLLVVGTLIRHLASPMPMRILIANTVIAIMFGIAPILGRKGKNPNLMAGIFFAGFIVLVGNGGLVAGGINAPICAFLPLFPVMGFCFGGKKLGIAGLVISLALVGGLVLAESYGLSGAVLDPSRVTSQRVTTFIAILFASFAVGITYEATRRRSERRLVEISRLASLGTLAGGIAHEINNPLMILNGYASQLELLAKSKDVNPHALEQLAVRIESNTNRIAKIVSGLRTYARDENGEPFTETRLEKVVNSAYALCGERFKHANIIVKFEMVQDDLVSVRLGQATEVILNVLNNAYDAVIGQDVRWVSIATIVNMDFVELSVTDSGPGVPSQIQTKIFAPFFTTKAVGKGIGLGLSTSSSIMHQHGGEILLDPNSPNTKFVLRFKKYKSMNIPASNEVAS